MNHYIEINLKPDAEMRENALLNKVYTKIHKALCDLKASDIGVSFPDKKLKLGQKLRIHGSEERLRILLKTQWLGGLSGYCQVSDIQPIPHNAKYRTVFRQQSNMTAAKLRRLIKRGSITEQEAKQYKAKMFSKGLSLPYLELESATNGHKYRHFINFGELLDSPLNGEFSQFGLSNKATVPWF